MFSQILCYVRFLIQFLYLTKCINYFLPTYCFHGHVMVKLLSLVTRIKFRSLNSPDSYPTGFSQLRLNYYFDPN